MRRALVVLVALTLLGGLAAWQLSTPQGMSATEDRDVGVPGDPDRGRLVFYAGGCASCHATPGQQDRLRLGGGLELASPFGTFVAPNISPHQDDGIGRWRDNDLANALLAGVSPKGTHYFPAFPYPSYTKMGSEDVHDLMAFLRTLEPVAGKAPDHRLAFPFTIRRAIGLWKWLFFIPGPLGADQQHDAPWNRGRYLVEGLGHCGECHTPRNFLGATMASARLSGAPSLDGRGYAPNITPHQNGIGAWTKDDIAEVLASGMTPNFDAVGSSMVDVVRNTSQLPDADRAAIATYLLSLPPLEGRPKKTRPAGAG
jgi:mono/diheme cytochrome c family protein